MRTFSVLIACYFAFAVGSAHAFGEDWEQCALVDDLVILKNDPQRVGLIRELRGSLNSSNQKLVDRSNLDNDFSDQALRACLIQVDPKLNVDQISKCRSSLLLMPTAYLMRLNGQPKNVAASLNVSSDMQVEKMINFTYAKELPDPRKVLPRAWKAEWLNSCVYSK